MRYPASEKLEIIRLVEQSHLPARRTLEKLGVSRSTFYRWYDLYPDRRAGSSGRQTVHGLTRVWNRIPDEVREQIVQLALDEPELSPRELATRFTDTKSYFVSEASVYRLLKAHDLITSPAFIVIKAADEFKDKTTAPNQLWQTDFTYLKVIGWGWFYLSTILDDFSRYIIAWKLCTTMKAEDVTETLDLALAGIRLDQAQVVHRPRLLIGQRLRPTSRAIWRNGSTSTTSSMFVARRCIRRPRARSSAGIRRSRTASCSKTIICLAISKAQIGTFVDHYNHRRYHESLNNLTPADVYFGRGQTILLERERIKRDTIRTDACSIKGKPLNSNPNRAGASTKQRRKLSQCI